MVQCDSSGMCSFRVYLPDADRVEVVGSFTNWRDGALPLVKDPTGWWQIELPLSPGDHDFSYLVNGSVWLPDYAASGVKRNGYGGWVSQLHVSEITVTTRSRTSERLAA